MTDTVQSSKLRKSRPARVRAIASKKRVEHPELMRPTLAGVRAVCKREGILVMTRPMSPGSEGWAMSIFDSPCIMLSSLITNRRRKLYVLLHELGHVFLGHVTDMKMLEKRHAERNPTWIEESVGWRLVEGPSPTDQAIEAEADLFADLMLAGPA